MRDLWRGALVYGIICLGLWPWPVLQILHVESAAIIAATGFFLAGLLELKPLQGGASPFLVIGRQVALLALPLAMLSLSLVWAPNCAYATGLIYFIVFTVPSVVLGASLAALIAASSVSRKRAAFILAGIVIAIGGVIYDLGLHPQFFTHNHVFGGVLGPIYEEDIRWRPSYGWFRLLTLGWSVLCLLAAASLNDRRLRRPAFKRSLTILSTALGMGLIYLNAAPLGINTTYRQLEQQLDERTVTDGFVVHHNSDEHSQRRVGFLIDELEYHYALLQEVLDIEVDRRIHVYLYPNPFLRGRLTGSRFTSVTPVWLRRPQMHVLVGDSPRTITHELVHVVSREFGLPIINASPAIALIEGLAVALEAPSGGPSHDDLVLASLTRSGPDAQHRLDAIADRLSPLGFWTGRGAVAYSSSGSFVGYLLDAYGADPLKEVYRSGRFAKAYGKSLDALVHEWRRRLEQRQVVSAAAGRASFTRFSAPSLFERRCPHYVAPYRRLYYEAWEALEQDDMERALVYARESLDERGDYLPSLRLALQLLLADGRAEDARHLVDAIDSLDAGASFEVLKADVHGLSGDTEEAFARYDAVYANVPSHEDGLRTSILLRRRSSALPGFVGVAYDRHGASSLRATNSADSLALSNAALSRGDYIKADAWLPARSELTEALLERYALQVELSLARRTGDIERARAVVHALIELERRRGAIDALRYNEYVADMLAWRAANRKPEDATPD